MAPIHDAAMAGNSSRVRELVERQGVDATTLDGNGQVANGEESDGEEDFDDGEVPMAPVHYAAMCDAPHVLSYLLDSCGVPCDQLDGLRRTPLYHAAHAGNAKCVRLLLPHGADPTLAGRPRINPLGAAASNGHTECLKLLLAHFDPPSSGHQDDDEEEEDEPARRRRLARRRAMLELKDRRRGRTPLLQALGEGEPDAAELLLAAGADPTATDHDGRDAVRLSRGVNVGGDDDESMVSEAPDALQAKLAAAAEEPHRVWLLAKARLLGEAAEGIKKVATAARDARKPEREVRRRVRAAAPACLRGRVDAQVALPAAAVALVPTKPWDEEAAELSAVIARVVNSGEGGLKREHVRELMEMILPEWAWAEGAAEGGEEL